jgi:hypothetical protein
LAERYTPSKSLAKRVCCFVGHDIIFRQHYSGSHRKAGIFKQGKNARDENTSIAQQHGAFQQLHLGIPTCCNTATTTTNNTIFYL